MRKLRIFVLPLIFLAGCGAPGIVGKWSTVVPQGTTTMEFTGNTFKQSSDGEGNGAKVHFEIGGTYTYDGKKITMSVTDIKLPDELKQLAAAFDKVKEKPIIVDAKLDKDTLTLTPEPGGAAGSGAGVGGTFTRVK